MNSEKSRRLVISSQPWIELLNPWKHVIGCVVALPGEVAPLPATCFTLRAPLGPFSRGRGACQTQTCGWLTARPPSGRPRSPPFSLPRGPHASETHTVHGGWRRT